MSRAYIFTFRFYDADADFGIPEIITVIGHGNTRRSAEQSARRDLRRHGYDPAKAMRVGQPAYLPKDKR